MKLLISIVCVLGLAATSVWSQDLPTSFHFNCESGEASMDAHYDDTTWVVDGANLSYTESSSGRDAGMQVTPGRTFPVKVKLTPAQLDTLKPLVKAIVNLRSISLMPEHNFQGSFSSFTFSYGTPAKEISFEAPYTEINKLEAHNSGDQTGRDQTEPASTLLARFEALHSFLAGLSM